MSPAEGPEPPPPGARRILLLTEFFPASDHAVFGAFQRLARHLDALRRLGTVDVVFLWPERHEPSAAERATFERRARAAWRLDGRVTFVPVAVRRRLDRFLDLYWGVRGAIGFFHQQPSMATSGRRQARALRRLLAEHPPDLIFAHRIGAGAAMLRAGRGRIPLILDMDDLEHVALARMAEGTDDAAARRRFRFWSRLALHAEKRIARASDCVLVCSELDRATLLRSAPGAEVRVAPNTGNEFAGLPVPATPTALFVGIAHYGPNREAILWLANEIWPRVRATLADARLIIAGEGSDELPIAKDAAGIDLRGFVADLRPLYAAARLILCPVRRGGGTRIKIIEAALNGRPVVSTTVGAEGLAFRPGTELVLADDAAALAQRAAELLAAPERCTGIGAAARKRALALYDREKVTADLAALCAGFLRRDGSA